MHGMFFSPKKGDQYIDTSNYGNYYRPRVRSKNNARKSVLFLLLILVILVLWWGDFIKPVDKEKEYLEFLDKVCTSAVSYVKDPHYRVGLEGVDIPGRVIYVKLQELVRAEYFNDKLIDVRTGEKIAGSTNIRLEVLSADDVMCTGFAFPEDDRIIPEVFLIGAETITLNKGSKFVDPGAYATDNRDGNITGAIVRTGDVDINTAGTYYIYYVVKDKAGNQSKKVKRTIIVK